MPRFAFTPKLALLLLGLSAAVSLGWWLPNRAQDPEPGVHAEKFNCLSYSGYRAGQSPLTDRFASEAEIDADLALLAPRTRAIRTYAALEGPYEVAGLAQKHGLKMWQGLWLGGDRARNTLEMNTAIALAHKYPDTIERVVVGNEVLLRRDLPVAELIADIDLVKRSVAQKVAYADVSDFWAQFPQVAPHVDVALIHLLPYWEDTPTGIDHAVGYIGGVFRHFQALFPHTRITIGETGWPGRGRQRQGAVPGLLNEARFLRQFIALSQAEHFDYNFFEAFDQDWKYENEGIVGASWGLFSADRAEKIPPEGPLQEDAHWPAHAAFSLACGLILAAVGVLARQTGGWGPAPLVVLAVGLGVALGVAQADVAPVLLDVHVRLAAAVNLGGQALLAGLMVLRASGALPAALERTGADATLRMQALLRLRRPHGRGLFEDLCFVFVWAAMVVQALLLFDPRYREFPLASFAVPLLVTLVRAASGDLPRGGGGREEWAAGLVLAGCAIGSAIQEGAENGQSLVWNACAVVLAGPLLWRGLRPGSRAIRTG